MFEKIERYIEKHPDGALLIAALISAGIGLCFLLLAMLIEGI